MRRIIVRIPVDFKQFMDMAIAINEKHNYNETEEGLFNLAKHQSVIHQTEAFEKAQSLIPGVTNCNISVEPLEIIKDNTICIYQAIYSHFGMSREDYTGKEILEVINENNKLHWAVITE